MLIINIEKERDWVVVNESIEFAFMPREEQNELLSRTFGEFITALQFLTRICIVNQLKYSTERWGRSVKFFPAVGSIVGMILAGIVYGVQQYWSGNLPRHVLAAGLIIIEIALTGGLHCDGFMDTIDGIFSGRSRDRMLEIMKDSRVGAFGAMAFALLVLLKYSLLMDLDLSRLPLAFFVMSLVGRTGIVIAITLFNYARADGLGKSFTQYANRHTLVMAGVFTGLLLLVLGRTAILSGMLGCGGAYLFANYVNKRLGGLTGDVYGAVNEVTEIVVLLVFVCYP